MVAIINPKVIAEGNVEDIKPDLKRFDRAKEQVGLVVAELKKFVTITSEEQRDLALSTLSQANDVDKAIEKKRKELVAPWNDGAKSINGYVKELVMDLDPTIQQVKKAVLAFQKEEEQKAINLKRQARKEQVATLGLTYNEKSNSFEFEDVFLHVANLDVADDAWDRIIAETVKKLEAQQQDKLTALLEEKELVEAFGSDEDKMVLEEKIYGATKPAVIPGASFHSSSLSFSPSKLSGAAKVWKFKVNDEKLIPREYLVVDETLIRKAVAGGVRLIPGVEIYQDDQLRIR